MLKAHLIDRFGHAPWLVRIDRGRFAGRHVAERTGARADFTEDHHGGVLLGPALADIGTARLLTDGDKPLRAHDVLRLSEAFACRRLYTDPVRLAQDRRIWPVALLRVTMLGLAINKCDHGD